MTVFFNGGKARTADFNAGDIGLVPRTFGHYIENVGDTDLDSFWRCSRLRGLWIFPFPSGSRTPHPN